MLLLILNNGQKAFGAEQKDARFHAILLTVLTSQSIRRNHDPLYRKTFRAGKYP